MTSMTKAATKPKATTPTLLDFAYTVPAPVTTELVALAPVVAHIRSALVILSWRSPSWYDSWLALAGWWALCLLTYPALKYALPLLLAAAALLHRRLARKHAPAPLVTEQTLQRTLADLHAINALLPAVPAPNTLPLPPLALLRACALLCPPYLLLTHLVPLRVLLALAGTALLTWRAPWAHTARRIAWTSAHVRAAAYRAAALLTGLPPASSSPLALAASLAASPASPASARTRSQSQANAHGKEKAGREGPRDGATVRFLFTVHENQRWWMGLDWTSALLPAERPPWAAGGGGGAGAGGGGGGGGGAQIAVAPPAAFALPEPTVSYLPSAEKPTKGAKGGRETVKRTKRTARWSWGEGEWRVLVRRDAGAGASRVERPLPKDRDEDKDKGGVLKALGKAREASASAAQKDKDANAAQEKEKDKDKDTAADAERERGEPYGGGEDDPVTDADGWVYGDNKWEGAGPKGGLGKYTRCRRWTRVAVLAETLETVDGGELGVVAAADPDAPDARVPDAPDAAAHSANAKSTPTLQLPHPAPTTDAQATDASAPAPDSPTRSVLRQRLQAAAGGAGFGAGGVAM